MHSRIFQLSKSPLNAEDFINENTFSPEMVDDFADYISDLSGQLDEEYARFPFVPDMFEREGDKLIYKGYRDVFKKWHDKICENAAWLGVDSLRDSIKTFRLRRLLDTPFTDSRFVLTGYDEMPEKSSDFIQNCANSLKVGDVLYLGGVLDYHW